MVDMERMMEYGPKGGANNREPHLDYPWFDSMFCNKPKLPPKKEFLLEFVDALRSGEYTQLCGAMRDGEKNICAGGLIIDLLVKRIDKPLPVQKEGIEYDDYHNGLLHRFAGQKDIYQYLFFKLSDIDDFGNRLFVLNHIEKKSFAEIADFVEQEVIPSLTQS